MHTFDVSPVPQFDAEKFDASYKVCRLSYLSSSFPWLMLFIRHRNMDCGHMTPFMFYFLNVENPSGSCNTYVVIFVLICFVLIAFGYLERPR